MKKLLLFGVSTMIATFSFAQQLNQLNLHKEDMNPGVIGKSISSKKMVKRGSGASESYEFINSYAEDQVLGNPKYYVRWIAPDTNPRIAYTNNQVQNVYMSVVGTCFDPKDTTFAATGNTVLTKFNPYTMDTVAWVQYYVRNVDEVVVNGNKVPVVDTLIVQYFDFSGLDFRGFTYQNKSHVNASPKVSTFVPSSQQNTAAIKTDVILLDKSMHDSLNTKTGELFGRTYFTTPGIKSQSTNSINYTANITAFSLTFRPMIKAKLNDTLINWDSAGTWRKKINGFGVRMGYWSNNMHVITSKYRYNNSFWTTYDLAQGQTVNGWKSYLPTTAYLTSSILASSVVITCDNVGRKDINSGLTGSKIYPNPANVDGSVSAVFNLNAASSVSAQIVDINGRVVKSFDARQFNKGVNEFALNIDGLASGVYSAVLSSAVGTQSTKFIVR